MRRLTMVTVALLALVFAGVASAAKPLMFRGAT